MKLIDELVGFAKTIQAINDSDLISFQNNFPYSYVLLYLGLRVLPISICLYWLLVKLKIIKPYIQQLIEKFNALNSPSPYALFLLQSRYVLVAIMLLAFIPRFYFLFTSYITYNNDGMCRLLLARQYDGSFWHGWVWLPLHRLLLILLTSIGFDTAFSGRVVTMGLGLLSIPIFYFLVKKLFSSSVAFWAAMLLALNAFHIRYSLLYMTEVPFIFFVLVSILCLLIFIESGNYFLLLLSSIAVNCSNMIRFEGWLLAVLLPVYLFYRNRNYTLLGLYIISNLLFIGIYCLNSYLNTGNPVYGLTMSNTDVALHYTTLKGQVLQYIFDMMAYDMVLPIGLLIIVLYGMYKSFQNRNNLPYLLIGSMMLFATLYKLATLTIIPSWRYFSTSLFLLLPFGAVVIADFAALNKLRFNTVLLAVVILCVITINEAYQFQISTSTMPISYNEACNAIKSERKEHERVVFDTRGSNYCPWQEQIGMVENDFYQPHDVAMKRYDYYESFSDKVLLRLIQDTTYKYIFYEKNLPVDSIMCTPIWRENLHRKQLLIDTLYNGQEFAVLRINK